MASKKGKPMKNAQARNAVSERRLRPIYGKFKLCIAWIFFIVSLLSADKFQLLLIQFLHHFLIDWLDNGNNKKALQEAEKVLKRQPDFVCCRALKSLALIRLNRETEALPILDSITNAGTTDEGALQAMNIGYRELQQSELCFYFCTFDGIFDLG